MTKSLSHLERLEAESIEIFREVVATANNPVMLYSIGKDSAVMLRLALKAFYPAKLPFPLLHVDTRWKFRDMYVFREQMQKKYDFELEKNFIKQNLKSKQKQNFKKFNPFDNTKKSNIDRKSTRLNSSHTDISRMPSSA